MNDYQPDAAGVAAFQMLRIRQRTLLYLQVPTPAVTDNADP